MAYKRLTAAQTVAANAFMHDIFAFSGKMPSKRPNGSAFLLSASDIINQNNYTALHAAAETVADTVLNASFADIDSALNTLSGYRFKQTMDGASPVRSKKPEVLASFIAGFCAANGFYWDDSIRTEQELSVFKETRLGEALDAFGCFVSREDKAPRQRNVLGPTAGSSAASSTTANGVKQAPQNDYKSRGPQSGNVRDLKSTAGQKEIISQPYVYGIEGDNANAQKVKAFAFIKPMLDTAQGETNGTNRVFIRSSNGYTDCKVYLLTVADAQAFLTKCQNVASNSISNLQVVKKSVDPNGYYKVGTEFGDVYIPAKKLNEEVADESLDEAVVGNEEEVNARWQAFVNQVKAFDKAFERE